tara:strand:+ start:52 stop:339 length:288 start_codon:yes stop_codon:yes gene_type:complete
MLSTLFPFIYLIVVIVLLWQAFRVMGRGFWPEWFQTVSPTKRSPDGGDRTGRLTVHPEVLDEYGRITDEELLTVRFSGDVDQDSDPPQSAETSAE